MILNPHGEPESAAGSAGDLRFGHATRRREKRKPI
jgi:hypothetical protein